MSRPLPQCTSRDLALYLHLPFCDHKCAYCDFNSYAGQDHLMPSYVDALVTDIALWREVTRGWTVRTVFFGGGTPSLTPIPLFAGILDAVSAHLDLSADVEITLEANPGTVDEPYLRGLRGLGVNRLSLGVQSFDDAQLRLLDRIHDGLQARRAYRAARAAGFDNINLDLMFGLQGQDLEGWRGNLEAAVGLRPEHLSLYALTIEDGTKLARQVARGSAPSPDPDLQADMYETAADVMSSGGYDQYEISNWSLPGRSCRHNLVYWRNEPYLGLGAGAHSCFGGRRFAMVRAPGAYIERVGRATGGMGLSGMANVSALPQIASDEELDFATDASDTLILGLRLNEGVDLDGFALRYGVEVADLAGPALAEVVAFQLVEECERRLRLTDRGRLLSNEVFVRLLPNALAVPALR